MTHIKTISKGPVMAQIDPIESFILILLPIFFRDLDNIFPVLGSLQKTFSKTPSVI